MGWFSDAASSIRSGVVSFFKLSSSSDYSQLNGESATDDFSLSEKAVCALNAVAEALPITALSFSFWAFMINQDEETQEKFSMFVVGALALFELGDVLKQAGKFLSSSAAYEKMQHVLLFLKALLAEGALLIALENKQPELPPKLFCGVLATLAVSEFLGAIRAYSDNKSYAMAVVKSLLLAQACASLAVGKVGEVATEELGWAGVASLGGLFAIKAVEEYAAQQAKATSLGR